jgi:hypothetical protein
MNKVSDPRLLNLRNGPPSCRFQYIGRAVPRRGIPHSSLYGNPFKAKDVTAEEALDAMPGVVKTVTGWDINKSVGDFVRLTKHVGPLIAVDKYRRWLAGDPEFAHVEPERRRHILESIPELAGEVASGIPLVCWCSPAPCHGDVILELVDRYNATKQRENNADHGDA